MMPLLGNVAWETKNFLRILKIAQQEALRNAVDVVERLRDPNRSRPTIHPNLAPNGRHLRVQHTYSSMTISAFLIQQEGAKRKKSSPATRRRDGDGGGAIRAGLRLSIAEIRSRGETVI